MDPLGLFQLVLTVCGFVAGACALVIALRSTNHQLTRQVGDVVAIATRAEQRADKAVADSAATREHVEGVLEALEETYQRVDRKRKRAETAAAREERAASDPAPDDFDAALARARSMGFRV